MGTTITLILIYLSFSAFTFWALMCAEKKNTKQLTNGGMVFIISLSAMGPLSIAAAISALGDGVFEEWAKKPAGECPTWLSLVLVFALFLVTAILCLAFLP